MHNGILALFPDAIPNKDFLLVAENGQATVRYWNEQKLGPMPAVSAILAADATATATQNAAALKEAQDIAAAKAYAKLNALKNMSPAQVQAWVAANVTNLAQAQDAIATLAIAVSILARRL